MSDHKITDYTSVSKSNHKVLKFITIILSILIIICVFFLILGFINKFGKLEENKKIYYEKIKNILYFIQKKAKLFRLIMLEKINYY